MADDADIPQGPDDYSRSMGGQALGARLRRLSERIDRDGTAVYAARGVRFEQRWFGVLNQMMLKGRTTVGEIAATMRITHVSVSQACRSLEAAGIIAAAIDPVDARRRILTLTPKGDALILELAPLWAAFNAAAAELNAEAGDAVIALDRLDDALARRSMSHRIADQIARLTPPQNTAD